VTTFVLVHGAWHGAWCWDRLIPELEQRGHAAIAMDLPIDVPRAGMKEYAAVVARHVPRDEPVALVGHSLGASVIPLVAASVPVQRLVFLCPVLRMPGRTLASQAEDDAGMATADLSHGRVFFDDSSSAWEPDAAIAAFYGECDPATASWAASHLRRQYWRYWEEDNPLDAWPLADYRAIVCTADRMVDLDWARRAIPERLGVEPVEIPGDHSPFLSVPARLAEALTAP
jgi:pimeloyl-ACP methyl ester carboxylesterase